MPPRLLLQEQFLDGKVLIFHKRRRKNSRRLRGHRQVCAPALPIHAFALAPLIGQLLLAALPAHELAVAAMPGCLLGFSWGTVYGGQDLKSTAAAAATLPLQPLTTLRILEVRGIEEAPAAVGAEH